MPKHFCLSLLFALILPATLLPALAEDADTYGPVDTFKLMITPFGAPSKESTHLPGLKKSNEMTFDLASGEANASLKLPIVPAMGAIEKQSVVDPAFSPINLSSTSGSLLDRLTQTRLYLPGRMILGKAEEFVVKGRAGSYAAIAMADKDSGAKPIYGHALRLGPDRKVVAVGEIPHSGVLSLFVCTPIEGDLIGQDLFFEAAVWRKSDYSDLQIAKSIDPEGQASMKNGVMVSAETIVKKGPRIVPNSRSTYTYTVQPGAPDIDSGRP